MSFEQNIPFDVPANYQTVNTEISDSSCRNVLAEVIGLFFNEDFLSDVGHVYDPEKMEFSGGDLQQKEFSGLCGATFNDNENLNSWSNGDRTGTFKGTGNTGKIEDGKLIFENGDNSIIDYIATDNCNNAQEFTMEIEWIPGYSGYPSTTQFITHQGNSGGTASQFQLSHSTTGNIHLDVRRSDGVQMINNDFENISVVAGQKYILSLNVRISTNINGSDDGNGQTDIRLFRDGEQSGAVIDYIGGSRDTADINTIRFGSNYIYNGGTPLFSIDSFVFYDGLKRTESYTPVIDIPYLKYAEAKDDLPTFEKETLGVITLLTNLQMTSSGTVNVITNGKYWNGSAWIASDESFSQSNTLTEAVTNYPTFDVTDLTEIEISIIMPESDTQNKISDLTLTYTGEQVETQGYTKPNAFITAQEISSVIATEDIPDDTSIGYVFNVNGINKYHDGSEWTNSTDIYTQNNTLTEVQENIETLISQNSTVYILIITENSVLTARSSVSSITLTYDFSGIIPDPTKCIVYGKYIDVSGNPINDATVRISLHKTVLGQYKEASESIVEKYSEVLTGASGEQGWEDGYFEIETIRSSEYEGSGYYSIEIFKNSEDLKTNKTNSNNLIKFIVPDETKKNITELIRGQ